MGSKGVCLYTYENVDNEIKDYRKLGQLSS